MTLDIVNDQNEKVGALEIDEGLVAGRVRSHLIWEAIVHEQASARRGTHATKNRALVSGSGKKPWRQKGTGRARAGEIRNPLWRKGGTVFGPQPRSYGYALPRQMSRGALGAAFAQRLQDGSVVVIDQLSLAEPKAKLAAELLGRLGAARKTLLVDVRLNDNLTRSTRNLRGVRLVSSGRLTARDLMTSGRIVVTRAALERLQDVLGGRAAAPENPEPRTENLEGG